MRWRIILFLLLMCFSVICSMSVAQTTIVVTEADVELHHPDDPDKTWRPVDIIDITNSIDPVGTHIEKGKLGIQTWEFLLQEDEPVLGKVIVRFNLLSLPASNFRSYIIRVRVRDSTHVSNWVISDPVRILGKPGKASHIGNK